MHQQPQHNYHGQQQNAQQQQQQNMQQQQQNVMPQPPDVITSKDHSYMEDMMSWNLDVVKKSNFFAEQCQDPEIKQALQQVCQLHQRHYNLILNHVQQHQNQNTNVQ
jgi:hypothetical protein